MAGCGRCGSKTKPLGTNQQQKPAQGPTPARMPKARSSPKPLGKAEQDTSTQGRTETFVLQTTDGRTMTFGSRLESEAARVRAGGGSIRRN